MGLYWPLTAITLILSLAVVAVALVRKAHRRRRLIEENQKKELLKNERIKLVVESGNLLAIMEQELPEALKSPDSTARSPIDPLGIILTDEARDALRKRSAIANRISAIDREMKANSMKRGLNEQRRT